MQKSILTILTLAVLAMFVAASASAQTTLIAKGATWKYLDDGSDQGTAWRAKDFDDSGWSSGQAQFGYGNNGEDTKIGFGDDGRNKHTTYFFRHAFDVSGAAGIKGLTVSLVRDDGAIVYLNGKEIFRSNMPEGEVGISAFAAKVVGGADEKKWFDGAVDAGALVEGKNVIAVEIHQANAGSSDLGFDLELATGSGGAVAPVKTPGAGQGPGGPVTLLKKGSTWKYLDDGSDQGTAWRGRDFDDAAWASGPAKLGFGNDGEVTKIGFGDDGQNKNPTTYFRTSFTIDSAAACQGLKLGLVRDDGAVVYVNGKEIFRSNMPDGPIVHTAFSEATVGGGDEKKFFEGEADASCLVDGKNVVAVEIHQTNARSTDLGFDLELTGLMQGGAGAVKPTPGTPAVTPGAGAGGSALIAKGATWKYLDDGTDQGTAWRGKSFDDAAWSSGPAQFGYGNNGEATEISFGDDKDNKHVAYYFRKSFEVAKAASVKGLTVRVVRDDGAVVYLNGKEVFRTNMPEGEIGNTTSAVDTIGGAAEKEFHEATVDAGLLVDGKNVIAVEVHQRGGVSTDLSFDFELLAGSGGGAAPTPTPVTAEGGNKGGNTGNPFAGGDNPFK